MNWDWATASSFIVLRRCTSFPASISRPRARSWLNILSVVMPWIESRYWELLRFLTAEFCALMRLKPRADDPTNNGVNGTPASIHRPTTQSIQKIAAHSRTGIAMATQIWTK